MSLIDVLFNRKKLANPAKITLKNIKKFLQGNYYKLVMKVPYLTARLVKASRVEQMAWRRTQVAIKSPECFSTGTCFCGCDVEGLIAADAACEQEMKCFPEMMTHEEWKEFKTKNRI